MVINVDDTIVSFMPCPLCGSDSNITVTSEDEFYDAYEIFDQGFVTIKCSCGLSVMHMENTRGYGTALHHAMNKWNTRKEQTCKTIRVNGENIEF